MNPILLEWLELVFRWIHVVTGIAWIGASFYFVWLNLNMRLPETPVKGVDGDLWAVHGGSFYQVTRYEVAPEKLPKTLHWFKWEAYFTLVTGFILLAIVYYIGAESYLIDPAVAELTQFQAIGIGLAVLVGGWIVYDQLCKSPLSRTGWPFTLVLFGFFAGVAFGLTQVFSSRGAFIHVGAMIGTIMAVNVFAVIIPNQRKMVDAMIAGDPPDPEAGQKGQQRSFHNNYLTLPVIYIMISNHYPITFGHEWNWLILIALSLIAVGVRHYFNLKHRGKDKPWILGVAGVAMVVLAVTATYYPFDTASEATTVADTGGAPAVSFHVVRGIIELRCNTCHATAPTDDVFKIAPNGVKFETPEQIKAYAQKIKQRVVVAKTMPLANKTKITDEERELLGRWVDAGAEI